MRQGDGSKLIHWPFAKAPADADPRPSASPRRRRRSSSIRQWLPTALFISIVALLVLLLITVRIMLGSTGQTPQTSTSGTPAVANDTIVSPPEAVAARPPEHPPGQIRFSAHPVEPSYTVATGDTLWSIADRNRTTVEAVQSINNLSERATLSVGQRLVMP